MSAIRSLSSASPSDSSSIYASQTASQSAGNGTSDVAVTTGLTNLEPNTLYHYRLAVTNGAGTTYGADQAFTTSPSPYDNWYASEFPPGDLSNSAIVGPTATPVGDGVPNLLKYALGLNPLATATHGMPVQGKAVVNGTSCFTFTYTKVDSATDVTYHPQWSGDLSTWSNTGLSETVLSDNGTSQQVMDSIPATGLSTIFFVLNVTMP